MGLLLFVIFVRDPTYWILLLAAWLVLSLHPIPRMEAAVHSRLNKILFKYFSLRIVRLYMCRYIPSRQPPSSSQPISIDPVRSIGEPPSLPTNLNRSTNTKQVYEEQLGGQHLFIAPPHGVLPFGNLLVR
jgi:hypothetical protein